MDDVCDVLVGDACDVVVGDAFGVVEGDACDAVEDDACGFSVNITLVGSAARFSIECSSSESRSSSCDTSDVYLTPHSVAPQ